MRPHQKRYLIEVLPALALVIGWIVFSSLSTDGKPQAWMAVLPLIAVAWMLGAMLRRLLRKDEFEQRIELIAIAISSAAVGLGSFAWSLFESAGILARGSLFYVLPCLIAIYGAAKLWALWRYR